MLGRAGWRKKCFKLPIRCFKLPIRDAIAVADPELRVADAATIMIEERVANLVREKLRLAV